MTAVEWFIEQIKEYDFTPPSNNEEYVIVMPKWIFDAKRDEAKELEKQQIMNTYIIADSESTQEDSEHYALKFYERTYGSKGSETKQSLYTKEQLREAFRGFASGKSFEQYYNEAYGSDETKQ